MFTLFESLIPKLAFVPWETKAFSSIQTKGSRRH